MSPDSGQLIENPARIHWAYENRWSPTQAIGRYESTLSLAPRRSKSQPPPAAMMNPPWVRHTPLGAPVVPEVYRMIAMSSDCPLATSAAKYSGFSRSNSRPISRKSSRETYGVVLLQPARIIEVDEFHRRNLRRSLDELVHLLLILGDHVDDRRVVEHIGEFRRLRVLVHRNRNAAQRLRRRDRPIETRAIVADDRQVHPALEALRCKPASERAHLLGDLAPGPGLPDAEILLPHGRSLAAHVCVVQQAPRKAIGHSSRPSQTAAPTTSYANLEKSGLRFSRKAENASFASKDSSRR